MNPRKPGLAISKRKKPFTALASPRLDRPRSVNKQVAPFDLVFEYNHAVEGWQALSRPTISRLGEMVHTIGDFMREMSQLVQKEYARQAGSGGGQDYFAFSWRKKRKKGKKTRHRRLLVAVFS